MEQVDSLWCIFAVEGVCCLSELLESALDKKFVRRRLFVYQYPQFDWGFRKAYSYE